MTKSLSHIRNIVVLLFSFFLASNTVFAQNANRYFTVSGSVFSSSSYNIKTTLPYALVSINAYGINTSTDVSGKFSLSRVPAGKIILSVKYLGKITLDTVITVSNNLNLELFLANADFRLKLVTVNAKTVKSGNGTSSKISRTAIDHMQANSLADVMSLLPGGLTSNPNLTNAKQIVIRSAIEGTSAVNNLNAFGTSIVINGAPVTNNANLQALSPSVLGGSSALAGGANPGAGFDTRGISMDNVESVEVIRGVPGVEYGDVTTGVVLVNTKAGAQPLRIRAKTNPNVYQVSATKGTELGGKNGALNLGLDYARNVNDPVQSYLTYQRVTANALYSNLFFKRLKSTSSVDLIYGKDGRQQNPDDLITKTNSNGRDVGFVFNTRGNVGFDRTWLRNINYVARIGYTKRDSYFEEQQTAATAPYSSTLTDGAILSNRPNTDVFDASGNKLTNISAADRDLVATMLPSTYIGSYNINGKELNTYFKLLATFYNKIGATNNKWILGADFKSDENFGDGKSFASTAPPSRSLSAVNASFRPRSYKDIPALNQVGLFAEENFDANFGKHQLQITAGVRYDRFSGNRNALSPRVNASFDVVPNVFSINGAYGKLSKAPAVLYLSPENAYFEYININESGTTGLTNPVVMTTTRIFNTENKDLKIAKNQKAELGFQLNVKQATLKVTGFSERLKDGYTLGNSVNGFQPLVYNEYIRAATTTPTNTILQLKESNNVLAKFAVPTNDQVVNTKGIEFDLDLGRFESIRSAFSINGALMRTESYSSGYTYYDGQSTTGGAGRTHIGLYEPGVTKLYNQTLVTALRSTHNIPQIGFVVTLTTQVQWNQSFWGKYGNDSIPVKYISKNDGKVYDFNPDKKNDAEFKTLLDPIDARKYTKESYPPVLSFNLNLTKEISDYMRASFFANNMFRYYNITESKRYPGTFIQRNTRYFFGLELSITLK